MNKGKLVFAQLNEHLTKLRIPAIVNADTGRS
jgi:hypothetical protein